MSVLQPATRGFREAFGREGAAKREPAQPLPRDGRAVEAGAPADLDVEVAAKRLSRVFRLAHDLTPSIRSDRPSAPSRDLMDDLQLPSEVAARAVARPNERGR